MYRQCWLGNRLEDREGNVGNMKVYFMEIPCGIV
jgi:hypothetical protein